MRFPNYQVTLGVEALSKDKFLADLGQFFDKITDF